MEEHLAGLIDCYTKDAPNYIVDRGPEFLEVTRPLIDRISVGDARAICDLGAGVGSLLPYIRERAPHALIVGTDLTAAMLERAPKAFPLVAADAEKPLFKLGSLDVVVSTFMFHHLRDLVGTLRIVRESLRKEGVFALMEWGEVERSPFHEIWSEELRHAGAPEFSPKPQSNADIRAQMDSAPKMGKLLREGGFDVSDSDEIRWTRGRTVDEILELKDGPVISKRLTALEDSKQEACLDRVRRRVATLAPRHRDEISRVVWGVGVNP